MADYVLVHGAFMGDALWEPLATALRRANHRVLTPTLTGSGSRAHLATPDVGLATHVADVMGELTFNDLGEVILVSHSYGGVVATKLAEKAGDRLAHLVFIDAILPADGQSCASALPDAVGEMWRADAEAKGDGWRIPVNEQLPPLWGVTGGHLDYICSRLTPFPLKCVTDPVSTSGGVAALPGTFITGAHPDAATAAMFEPFAARFEARGRDVHRLPTGHFPHVEAAGQCAEILAGIAQ